MAFEVDSLLLYGCRLMTLVCRTCDMESAEIELLSVLSIDLLLFLHLGISELAYVIQTQYCKEFQNAWPV
jgi:hypothetical protein